MNLRSLIVTAALVSIISSQSSWGGVFDNIQKPVLSADTNHDGKLNLDTIKKGQDFIIVKPNPAQLAANALVLQTKNSNLYTAATWEDLQAPNAFRKLMLAKVTNDGTIKVYTLSNLGYSNLQVNQNSNNSRDVYLVSFKGKMDKITEFDYAPKAFHVYEPTLDKKSKPT